MHVGLASPAKSIRLTGHDENYINNIGFAFKMIGNKVMYIHSNSGDIVSFYNNNKATLIIQSIPGSKIMKTIPEMLTYLGENWNITGFKGIAGKQTYTPTTVGNKVSPIIEKQLASKMFHWSPELTSYVSNVNGDSIKINGSNKSSVLSFYKGQQQKHFSDLASLLKYINGGGYTQYLQNQTAADVSKTNWDDELSQAA